MPNSDETSIMKVKDLFEGDNLLTGRTEIENISKINVGLIWSANGFEFLPNILTNSPGSIQPGGFRFDEGGTQTDDYFCAVHLPNGATVTSVVVNGAENAASAWALKRVRIDSQTVDTTMASGANLDTEDTTITAPTINNSDFRYYLEVTNLDGSIHGAKIVYTI